MDQWNQRFHGWTFNEWFFLFLWKIHAIFYFKIIKWSIRRATPFHILTWPNNENFILPSLSSWIACGFWLLIMEQMMPAIPLGFTHNGIPLNRSWDGLVFMKIDVYFSPNTSFNCVLIMANCGGIVLSAIWRIDFKIQLEKKMINVSIEQIKISIKFENEKKKKYETEKRTDD